MTRALDDANPNLRVLRSEVGHHLFVVQGSRLYDVPDAIAERIASELSAAPGPSVEAMLGRLGIGADAYVDDAPPALPPVASLSLNVAQACNLRCGYCYADAGHFEGEPAMMSLETARRAVDVLLDQAAAGVQPVIGFMGGEPLLNKELVHEVARFADRRARERGMRMRFTITTNGTRVAADDVRLFHDLGFTVNVSMDGQPQVHDKLRLHVSGQPSYRSARRGLELLLKGPRPAHVGATAAIELERQPREEALLEVPLVELQAWVAVVDARLRASHRGIATNDVVGTSRQVSREYSPLGRIIGMGRFGHRRTP